MPEFDTICDYTYDQLLIKYKESVEANLETNKKYEACLTENINLVNKYLDKTERLIVVLSEHIELRKKYTKLALSVNEFLIAEDMCRG